MNIMGIKDYSLKIRLLLNSSQDLWREADVATAEGNTKLAQSIYQNLSKRSTRSPEDYLYAGLSAYRLTNLATSLDLFEKGLTEYPGNELLLETYTRIATESGQIIRVLNLLQIKHSSESEAWNALLQMGFIDTAIKINIFKHCIENKLHDLSDRIFKEIRNEADDADVLWHLADVLLQVGRPAEAKKIYHNLASRKPKLQSDYYFSALADLRTGNTERALQTLEAGQISFPNETKLGDIYFQACAEHQQFDRYVEQTKRIGVSNKSIFTSISDFYKHAIVSQALPLHRFILNFKNIQARMSPPEFLELQRVIQRFFKDNQPHFEHAKFSLFFLKYLDIDQKFSQELFDILISFENWGSDTKRAKRILSSIYSLTLPMIPHYSVDHGELIQKFIDAAHELASTPMLLSEPINDLSHEWTPWQFILSLATPSMYADSIQAFERFAFSTWPKLDFVAPHINKTQRLHPNRKIRIGFTAHDSMPMMSGLMSHLDKNLFETVFLRPGQEGQSTSAKNWTARADETIEYSDSNSYLAIETIAEQELDIIVSGPALAPTFYPLLARLASLQMTLLEPNWMDGTTNSDYYISWKPAEPVNTGDFYHNSVALLEHPPYWIERPSLDTSTIDLEKSTIEIRKRLFGELSTKRIYLCANTPPKIHPDMDAILLELLKQDSEAIVVLLRCHFPPTYSLKARLREKLGSYYDRVIALPTLERNDAHLLLGAVDCCLDSHPLSGMSSSFDGCMLGVPIVTLPKNIPFGKWTAAIYDYIGVSELTATTTEEYVAIAIKIATDKEWKRQKSEEIRRKSGLYVENVAAAIEFQEFILHAWQRKLDGLPPANWLSGNWVQTALPRQT